MPTLPYRPLQQCLFALLFVNVSLTAAQPAADDAIVISDPDCSIDTAEAALKRDDARAAADIAVQLLKANPADRKALSVLNRAQEKLNAIDSRLVDATAKRKDAEAILEVDRNSIVPALPLPVARPRFATRGDDDEARRDAASAERLKQKVTADFMNADLPYILDTLFKMTGVNIVADDSALDGRKITLHVHEMELADVLDFMVRKFEGLQYSVKNGNIWVTAEEGESLKKLMFTRIYPLHYGLLSTTKGEFGTSIGTASKSPPPQPAAKAEGEADAGASYLESMLNWIKKKEDPQIFPKDSDYFVDRQSNQIVVYTTPAGHRRIMEFLDHFDQPAIQVLIKTRFLEISLQDEKALGVNLDSLNTRGVNADGSTKTDDGTVRDPFRALLVNGLNKGVPAFLPGSLGPGSVFTFIGRRTDPQYQVTLSALMNDRHTKVLSAPEIIAVNNKQSLIDIATKFQYVESLEPVITQSSAGVGSTINNVTGYLPRFEPEDIGFKLAVTPSIGRDLQTVTLHLSPSIKSLAEGQQITSFQNVQVNATQGQPQSFPKPTIDETSFETDVVLKDNGYVIIGGLQRKFEESRERKVPGLSQIPYIGRAFKSTNRDVRKNNLVIIVEAHIISREGARYRDDDKAGAECAEPSLTSLVEPRLRKTPEPEPQPQSKASDAEPNRYLPE